MQRVKLQRGKVQRVKVQRVKMQRGKVQRVKVQREVMICHQPKQSASARTSNAVTTCMIVLLFCRFVVLLSSLRASVAGDLKTAGRPPSLATPSSSQSGARA